MKVKVLFGFLLLNGIAILDAKSDESACNYFQNLEAGRIYYVHNSDYPSEYNSENHCMWQIKSPFVTKINCSVEISASNGCIQDSLSIQFTGGNIQKYCGFGTLVLEGINPIIKLDLSNSYFPYRGRLLCQIQAKKPFDENNCNCGWKKVTRIVGGTETGVNEYPMMCGLVDSERRDIYCGCTIISQQYVLTAAHCIESKDITRIGILVGEHDVTTGEETNATKLFRVNKCIMHPSYKENNEQDDIAVCKIIGTINYSAEVGPVCLPFHHKQDMFVNNNVVALGWGLLEFGGAKSTTLQKVELEVISPTECKDYYSELTNSNICTYSFGRDSCQMDSGGPLLWQDPTTEKLLLSGIITGGVGCASTEPALAIRTGAYIDWIQSVTPDWGLMEFGGSKPDSLQKVNSNVINPKECEDAYSKSNDVNITNKNICTYTSEKDTYQMNSGGPLLWKNLTIKRLVLVCITSEGVSRASNVPAMYVRVGACFNWILSETSDVRFCGIE